MEFIYAFRKVSQTNNENFNIKHELS